MTTPDDFDRLLAVWLDAGAGTPHAPYGSDVLARVRGTRQRRLRGALARALPSPLAGPVYVGPTVRTAILVALMIVALVAALAAVGARPRLPFSQPKTGYLTFAANGQIHVAEPDGTSPRVIVGGSRNVTYPSWSPDGSRLAFFDFPPARPGSLWLADPDGTNARVLVENVSSRYPASWSPDGRRLVFGLAIPERNPFAGWPGEPLYLVDVDTGHVERLAAGKYPQQGASWSPDGEWLAVLAADPANVYSGVVEVVRPDGSQRSRVSRVQVDFETLPAWAPDGSAIAYSGDSSEAIFRTFLHVAELRDGRWHETALTTFPPQRYDVWDGAPSWSNSGDWISFLRQPRHPVAEPFPMVPSRFYVHVVPASGAMSPRPLVTDPTMGAAPCWKPDDSEIGFALRDVEGANQFAIVDVKRALEANGVSTVAEVGRTIAIPAHRAPVYFSPCAWQRIPIGIWSP